jgi:monofunctional biosynthetic peptidoglycan transglycosylase
MLAFLLIFGGLLMTLSAPPAVADDQQAHGGLLLTDFAADQAELDWYVVNDGVMGGRSEGNFKIEQGALHFAGSTNTRGGGFSSIRTRPVQIDLSQFAGIRLRVRGDGRRYTWRLATNARWRGRQISYWADFDTREGAWTTVDIPFSRFVPRYRGTKLNGPALEPDRITDMGLMIYDKQDGPFELRLASVHAYSVKAAFALKQYQWKNRVLVASAPDQGDMELMELQNELASRAEEFADRDMVFVTLLDSGISMADERQLTVAEVTATRAALEIRPGRFALRLIGKDGSVKLATESVTSLDEIFALIDTMPMRQREESDRQDQA